MAERRYHSPQREKTLHSIKYEGNLYKRGRGKKLSFVKPWSIRRFVLDTASGDLTYFKDIDGKGVQKGKLIVSDATAEKTTKEESGKPFSFKVVLGKEDLHLACSNDKDIEMWIDAINCCSKKTIPSPRRRTSSEPDRAFFLDSPSKRQAEAQKRFVDSVPESDDNVQRINSNKSKSDESDILDVQDIKLTRLDTDEDSDVDEVLSPNLSVKVTSSDGSEVSVPDFTQMVRGLPSQDENDVSPNSKYDCTIQKDDNQEENIEQEEAEFPPLEEKFQKILVMSTDFIIDTEHGVCGTGAFGTVYRATRKHDGKVVALKFFGYSKRDPVNLDILETEVDVMLKLKGFDVFAQIESFFYDTYEGLVPGKKFFDSYPVIVMEYLEKDLLSFLAISTSKIIATTLPQAFKELVIGLDCLHSKGFLHRDLKVDNVMISPEKKVKLIDFGFICALEEGEDEFLGPQTGTIGYFAPESIPLTGYSVFSAKSDIWQAGVILYTLVSGKMPFNISSFNIRKAKYPPLVCPSWESRPDAVRDLVSKILKLSPHDRISASEILAHEWLDVPELDVSEEENTDSSDNSHAEYLASINNLIQRRNIKKMLQHIQNDAEGAFDRSFKAESIMDSVTITGGSTYFMIRLGSLKALILQNMSVKFNLYDMLNYTEFCQMMAKNGLLELANVEMFSRFCHEHGYYSAPEDGVAATSSSETISLKELLLTLVALVGIPDQEDDALACFLKFDTKCTGYLEKESILHIFRGLLEDEAMEVATGNLMGGNVDTELDDIENELKEIEGVFACVEVKEGHPGIDFMEFKMFHDSVMKISTRVSTRLSMRSMSVVSMAVGKFSESLKSIRFKKQSGLAKTSRGELKVPNKSKKKADMSKTL